MSLTATSAVDVPCAHVPVPAGAIVGSVKNPHVIDLNKCIKCGACMEKISFGAIYKEIIREE